MGAPPATIDPLEEPAPGVLRGPKAREDGRRDLWRDRVPADQCLDKIEPRIGMGADNGESLNFAVSLPAACCCRSS
jgi:hypothetical protein